MVQEPELSSVLELENLRKSLDHGHSFHFDKTAKTCDEASALDASWVMHEEDSVVASQDLEREKRQLPVTPIVGDMLSMPASLSKLPRIRCARVCVVTCCQCAKNVCFNINAQAPR